MPEHSCPTPLDLERLMLGYFSDDEAAVLESHLEQCDDCVETLHGVQASDTLLEAVAAASARADEPGSVQVVSALFDRVRNLPLADAVGELISTPLTETRTPPPSYVVPRDSHGGVRFDFLTPPQSADELGRLGECRVLRVLGKGGMGVVFAAEDTRLKRPVALKVMKPGLAANTTDRERFLREAQAAAALKHDHIVTVYQAGESNGVLFLAMELLEGESLHERLTREGRMPLPEVLRLGREMAEGLAAAHARGLIHRDIKPANVWLEKPHGARAMSYRVKLLDFGLAKAESGDGRLTAAGALVGTPAYMAPEQIENQLDVDARCDLFALGCVLYLACTGVSPFQEHSVAKSFMAVLTREPQPPRTVNPLVPAALSDLVMRLLAKDRDKRSASAAAVAEELRRLEEMTSQSHPHRPSTRRATMALAAGVAAIAVLGVVIIKVQTKKGDVTFTVDQENGNVTVTPPGVPKGPGRATGKAKLQVLPKPGTPEADRYVEELLTKQIDSVMVGLPKEQVREKADQVCNLIENASWGTRYKAVFVPHLTFLVANKKSKEFNGPCVKPGDTLDFNPEEDPLFRQLTAEGKWTFGKDIMKLWLVPAKNTQTQFLSELKAYPDPEQPNRVRIKVGGHINGWVHNYTLFILYRKDASGAAEPPESRNSAVTRASALLPKEFTNSIGMKLVLVPRGKFLMGVGKGQRGESKEDSLGPQHEVEITRPFYMGVHEVTVGQFRAFVKSTNYKTDAEREDGARRLFPGGVRKMDPDASWLKPGEHDPADNFPVVCVSRRDIDAFCKWLSEKDSGTYRLPTEAEWEYACRAGSTTDFYFGDNAKELHRHAWYIVNADGKPHPVGQLKPNAWGLYDMIGNACEWCADWIDHSYYKVSPRQDPQGPSTGAGRVFRGGSWQHAHPVDLTSAAREADVAESRSSLIGFRVVREAPATSAALPEPGTPEGDRYVKSLLNEQLAVIAPGQTKDQVAKTVQEAIDQVNYSSWKTHYQAITVTGLGFRVYGSKPGGFEGPWVKPGETLDFDPEENPVTRELKADRKWTFGKEVLQAWFVKFGDQIQHFRELSAYPDPKHPNRLRIKMHGNTAGWPGGYTLIVLYRKGVTSTSLPEPGTPEGDRYVMDLMDKQLLALKPDFSREKAKEKGDDVCRMIEHTSWKSHYGAGCTCFDFVVAAEKPKNFDGPWVRPGELLDFDPVEIPMTRVLRSDQRWSFGKEVMKAWLIQWGDPDSTPYFREIVAYPDPKQPNHVRIKARGHTNGFAGYALVVLYRR